MGADHQVRTRVKICGIRRVEDAIEAVRLGVDALGLVFYPPSPRYVTLEQAAEIRAALPPFVTLVGLFVDADRAQIEEVVESVGLDLVQFHGQESPEQCAEISRPWIKAIRMIDGLNLQTTMQAYSQAQGILLDTYQRGTPGGTGQSFDWKLIPGEIAARITLAGGLSVENVADAIRQVQPFAVDVSGGVEAERGVKDAQKMALFLEEVAGARD